MRKKLAPTLLGAAVILIGAGVLLIESLDFTPVARRALEKSLPGAKVDVQEVKVSRSGEIVFKNFTVADPVTGKELARLEGGKIVLSLDDLARGRIGEVHLENPVIAISPGWSGVLPAPKNKDGTTAAIRRIVCKHGEFHYDGTISGDPSVHAKFCLDWKNFSAASAEPVGLTLWDIRASASGSSTPVLVLDLLEAKGIPQEMLAEFELREVLLKGGSLAVGTALDQLTSRPAAAPAPQSPSAKWKIGTLDISGIHAFLGDNAWRSETDAGFTIKTKFQNLSPAEIANSLGGAMQEIEISDLVIPSPTDAFRRVLSLRSVFLRFTLAGALNGELDDVTILHPVVYIGEDLFLYMERAQKRFGGGNGSATGAPRWKIKHLDIQFGSFVIGASGRASYGLPLNFRTTAQNVSLDELASLSLRGSLEIPARTYSFPDYELEFTTERGELLFSYPPGEGASNIVGTVRIPEIRFRQFRSSKSWLSATFDRSGINGAFGGAFCGGDITGGLSFLFDSSSPWIGWLGGARVDLRQLTDILAPQNFRMTGPLEFSAQLNANGRSIRRAKGGFTATAGTLEIGKINDLLARIPEDFSAVKRDSLRIALESLRDFDYSGGEGGFWFADGNGVLDLKLQGPLGSRTFHTVLHADESPAGRWKQTSAP